MNAPVEIERKYIIEKPTAESMQKMENYSSSEITQVYLKSPIGITHRVRKRIFKGKTVCTETKKVRIDKISAYEDEKEISEAHFEELSLNIKEGTAPIIKTRHVFLYKGQTFEIDIYPAWQNICIMETELPNRECSAEFPDFIKIKAEVSGIREFSNASLAGNFPKEENIKLKVE